MKKATKITLLIALIMVIVGAGVASAAFVLGAKTELYWNNGFQVMERGERQEIDEILPAFSMIEAELNTARVTIRYGDAHRIEGVHYDTLRYEVQGDTLYVTGGTGRDLTSTGHIKRLTIGFRNTGTEAGRIVIFVPYGMELSQLNIRAGTGRIELADIAAGSVRLRTGTGGITTRRVNLNDAFINTGTGSISFEGELAGTNELITGTGSISFEGRLSGMNKFRTGTGRAAIRIPMPRERYSYAVSTSTGGIMINGKRQGKNVVQTVADPLGYIQLNTGTGSVSLHFSE